MNENYTGLDYDFLRFLPVVPEEQKRNQRMYLDFFEGCETVVDLGCGEGNFVELLEESGIHGIGVDSDPRCCEAAWERDLQVVQQDAFDYLDELEPGSIDGVFASHLVEHLRYKAVLRLFELSHRALRPGGVIVVTTPNVRGLYAHLEMFYMHFGHVTFYHPRLLEFFFEYVGFEEPITGENPAPPHPLLGDLGLPAGEEAGSIPRIAYERELPRSKNPLRRLIWHGKMFLVKMVVQPYLDQIVREVNRRLARVNETIMRFDEAMGRMDRPFECYVVAKKAEEVSF